MRRARPLTVTYMDGTTETWERVDKAESRRGMLHLIKEATKYTDREVFACVPLTSIRKWEWGS